MLLSLNEIFLSKVNSWLDLVSQIDAFFAISADAMHKITCEG